MPKFDLFAGVTDVDRITVATTYLAKRRYLNPRKVARALRIAHGLRGAPAKAKEFEQLRPGIRLPHVPTRPHLVLVVTNQLADPIVPKKGNPLEVRRAVFVDRSRYPRFPNRAAFEAARRAA
jgi:hypothetical protein